MKVVVDTNIVFSAILNSSSNIGKILITSGSTIKLYSCNFLQDELILKREKLQRLTKLDNESIRRLISITTHNIQFIDESLLPPKAWKEAVKLTKDFDLKDAPFVALCCHLDALLWSGDKKLRSGILKRGFKNSIDTKGLLEKLGQ